MGVEAGLRVQRSMSRCALTRCVEHSVDLSEPNRILAAVDQSLPHFPALTARLRTPGIKDQPMFQSTEVLLFLSSAGLGLFVGALLTEAVVLVPMWRALKAQEFFALHAAHAHRLYAFFAPLTVCAVMLAVSAAIASVAKSQQYVSAAVVAAALALVMLATYPLYFRRANASFAEASIAPEALPAELARWALWHWFRTVVGLAALASSLLALCA